MKITFRSNRATLLVLLVSLILIAACRTSVEPFVANAPTPESTRNGAENVESTPVAATSTPDNSASSEQNQEAELTQFNAESVSLQLELVTDGLTSPVFATHAGDGSGRIFIVEQPGMVRIIEDGQLLSTPFLDIQERVRDQSNEQGLLGLAFAPNYAASGTFYLNYTNADGATTVSRFQRTAADANQADPASESIVLTIAQPAGNHNGGMITFGPEDGYLYIGTGDGGAANDRYGNGQNPSSLLGKMLRIDVTSDTSVPYTIPADNPWVNGDWQNSDGTSIDVLDEIWAVGLRNPWRFSFDRATNDLWIGDVGQNKYEEIHFTSYDAQVVNITQTADTIQPLNYGWPIMEGLHCFSPSSDCNMNGLVQPVAEYGHSGHCSVTGGYVYRGERFAQLNGVYFYGDFCSGVIWAMWPHGDGTWGQAEMMKSETNLSSFGEDEAGELYLADRSGSLYLLTVQGP